MKYPVSWKVFTEQTSEGCFDEINWCVVNFAPNFITALGFEDVQFEIAKTSFEKDTSSPCENCDSLIDSVMHWYQDKVKAMEEDPYSESFEFINDSQTTIGGNNSAWQIEYKEWATSAFDNRTYGVQYLELITKFNGSDYVFSYNAPSTNDFVDYLPVAKSMIDSVEFISAPKKPSFLP